MHKTTIYLDEGLYATIRRLAEAKGITQAALIRNAVVAYASGKKQIPRSVGLGQSGSGDLSEHAEELLKGMGDDR